MKGLIPGKIVHYVNGGGWTFAAIVTHVVNKEKGIVNLTVFYHYYHKDLGTNYGCKEVPYSEGGEPYTWHWMPEE